MAYTALEDMRKKNAARFGMDVGPTQPVLHAKATANDLKSASLRFLHDTCEDLRFDGDKAKADCGGSNYLGSSTAPNQIPWNMQMDIDRLCMERELEKFIDSGTAHAAYTVYYCYLEMFFGHYGKSKKMVELLSEFEENGSSLLMKHRDHYSHSVYVFALGLAIYETNAAFRNAFRKYYGFSDTVASHNADHAAAHAFLELWGLTSLFHDIGYPFELPFEQVLSYFEVDGTDRDEASILMAYQNIETITHLDADAKAHFFDLYNQVFNTTDELFAHDIMVKLGQAYDIDEHQLRDTIAAKPGHPDQFGCFMDHAWFSANRLLHELIQTFGISGIRAEHIDALSAILLHNSLYKFAISFYKSKTKAKSPLTMDLHPLAYLLMLCDELQCWDRTAYGRNSRRELHPMSADFDFSDNAIRATYYYDEEEQEKIQKFRAAYEAWESGGEEGDPPRLKAYSDMAEKEQRFTADIKKIVDTTNIPLTVIPAVRPANRENKGIYLSDSSFLHLYDFAVALNARYSYENREADVSTEEMEADFETLSLEYQLSNINQAKSFSRYLNAIGCFFSDRPVDYDMVTAFTPEQTAVFAPMEHERWVREHIDMAWMAGNAYEILPLGGNLSAADEKAVHKALREQMRMHKLAMSADTDTEAIFAHYQQLPEEEQGKDWKPFNSMLRLIRKYDGLRIYKL